MCIRDRGWCGQMNTKSSNCFPSRDFILYNGFQGICLIICYHSIEFIKTFKKNNIESQFNAPPHTHTHTSNLQRIVGAHCMNVIIRLLYLHCYSTFTMDFIFNVYGCVIQRVGLEVQLIQYKCFCIFFYCIYFQFLIIVML